MWENLTHKTVKMLELKLKVNTPTYIHTFATVVTTFLNAIWSHPLPGDVVYEHPQKHLYIFLYESEKYLLNLKLEASFTDRVKLEMGFEGRPT